MWPSSDRDSVAGEGVEKVVCGPDAGGLCAKFIVLHVKSGGCAVVRFFVGIRDMRRFVPGQIRVSGSVVLLIYRTADGLVV